MFGSLFAMSMSVCKYTDGSYVYSQGFHASKSPIDASVTTSWWIFWAWHWRQTKHASFSVTLSCLSYVCWPFHTHVVSWCAFLPQSGGWGSEKVVGESSGELRQYSQHIPIHLGASYTWVGWGSPEGTASIQGSWLWLWCHSWHFWNILQLLNCWRRSGCRPFGGCGSRRY